MCRKTRQLGKAIHGPFEIPSQSQALSAIMLDKRARFLQFSAHMKTTTLPLRNSISRSRLRLAFLLIPLVCFALSPQAEAVCQQGCLTNENTVLGDDALINNTFSFGNTAIGSSALANSTIGVDNTAVGFGALANNTSGNTNTAIGAGALESSASGDGNTATGNAALFVNTTGKNNTAIGRLALGQNMTGSTNIGLGIGAGYAITTGSNNIDIANPGKDGESSTIRIGRVEDHTATFIAGIAGATVPTGVAVIINANGHLGTTTSSERFKDAIKPMDEASEAILALKPVTFRYRHGLDAAGIPQFGLVAEEVEKVNPDLVARDEQGKPYSVRYEAVNAMLLNEFLKEHKKVEQQQRTIVQLESTVAQQREGFEARLAQQQKQIEALTAGLQKVSAQLEVSKTARRTVQNSQ
jgi:Chaperone of endosialidase